MFSFLYKCFTGIEVIKTYLTVMSLRLIRSVGLNINDGTKNKTRLLTDVLSDCDSEQCHAETYHSLVHLPLVGHNMACKQKDENRVIRKILKISNLNV